jgi:hypothetical protein
LTQTSSTETCGGAWRNSVYQQSTNNWEKAGYDDRGWQAAADLGPNGVAPWNRRPTISENAHWIWTMDPGANAGYQNSERGLDSDNTLHTGDSHGEESTASGVGTQGAGEGHGNIFCRYSQPNQAVNCPAAQARYWEDNPSAKADLFPAWLHYQDVGKAQGRPWPSELCNTCGETTGAGLHHNGGITTNCDASIYNGQLGQCFNQGTTTDGQGSNDWGGSTVIGGASAGVHGEQYVESHSGGGTGSDYTYEEGLVCTDKCRGKHDAAVATMVGAISCHMAGSTCHGGHYGLGFAGECQLLL